MGDSIGMNYYRFTAKVGKDTIHAYLVAPHWSPAFRRLIDDDIAWRSVTTEFSIVGKNIQLKRPDKLRFRLEQESIGSN